MGSDGEAKAPSSLRFAGAVQRARRWNYTLLHGDDELESGWNPSQITPEQAAGMLRLLQSHHENRVGLELFRALDKRIDERQHA
jgi:hypothetical protein